MNLLLSEGHLQLREEVAKFAQQHIAPFAAEFDRRGPQKYCSELMAKVAQKGWLGICFPKEYDGLGKDFTSYVIVTEEISKGYEAMGPNCQGNLVAAHSIYRFGTEEQKQKYLKPLARGEHIGAFSLAEANAGSDAAGLETEYVLEGDSYVITGRKRFISNATVARTYLLFARAKGSRGHQGVSAFIVEKGTPGFSFGKIDEYIGAYGHLTGELIFKNCRVPKGNLLGEEGNGFVIAMSTLEIGRTGECAQALAVSENCLKVAAGYAQTRVQFGKPIADFQAIRFMLADMGTEIEAARLLVYHAARLIDLGYKATKESSMAKLYASDIAMRCANKAVSILGARGLTKEYPVERYFRTAKMFEVVVGTAEVQRTVIGREVLKQFKQEK